LTVLRRDLTTHVQAAVDRLVAEGRLPSGLPPVELQDTKDPAHGDFATNFAMVAAKGAGMKPRALAEVVAAELQSRDEGRGSIENALPRPLTLDPVHSVEVAGPGFINLRLHPVFVAAYVPAVAAASTKDLAGGRAASPSPQEGERRLGGEGLTSPPKRINVEFVSVNPNGPITIGSGRGAAYGSTLANVLEAAGNVVHREYYINDGVNSEQMRLFARSLQKYIWEGTFELIDVASHDNDTESVLSYVDSVNERLGHGLGGKDEAFFFANLLSYAAREKASDSRASLTAQWLDGWARDLLPMTAKLRYQSCYVDDVFKPFAEWIADYKGDYVIEVARQIYDEHGTRAKFNSMGDSGVSWFQSEGQRVMVLKQSSDLAAFGVEFDTWFSEQSLHDSGAVESEIAELVAKGAADDRPIRHKLKLAKGGRVEDVEIEEQAAEEDPESPSPQEGEKGWDEGRSVLDIFSPSPPNPLSPARGEGEKRTLWLRSTKFGDDMDRVLRRKDGRLTYIASDIAYHKDKLERTRQLQSPPLTPQPPLPSESGDEEPDAKLITILGPDHHGYIGRLHAVMAAVEADRSDRSYKSNTELTDVEAKLYASPEERDACLTALEKARRELDVVIFQLVRFMKDGKPAPMRKRDGNIYALIDLIDEIGKKVKPEATQEEQRRSGKDVARFFYLMRSHDTTFDFDLDLAEKQSDENPVFYVQYAHARICSLLRKAEESGFPHPPGPSPRHDGIRGEGEYRLLTHPKETALIKKILDLPFEVSRCAEDYAVHRLTTYAIELARSYHHFYDACRVIQPDQPELTRARLLLCEATRVALRAVFELLGIEAPESM